MSIYFFKYKENNTFLDGKIKKRKKEAKILTLASFFAVNPPLFRTCGRRSTCHRPHTLPCNLPELD